ncbi:MULTISPECIES: BadF/BadG/BcrA/BcrD ATPase family protein [unclassified Isoptericola]|uniref:BadF/BadG/BcrA/BcrD ATPase family protein n=1 Tax=unclassified Isoptericola TaxID=2623355 RepID=UPI0036467F91
MIVGVDVGGTKTSVAVEAAGAPATVTTVASDGWRLRDLPGSVAWLVGVVRAAAPGGVVPPGASVAVGAHGAESDEHCVAVAAELRRRLPGARVRVVNDAELVVPAAGHERGVGVIAGTGAVAVGRDAAGSLVRAGGWGWVLHDDGSGSALVREAARAVLLGADRGAADPTLARALLDSVGAADLDALASALSWDGGVETWGRHAPAVFAAREAGSAAAAAVVESGAAALAAMACDVVDRGAAGGHVVLAGGVVAAQAGYARRVGELVRARRPDLAVGVLAEPPVRGALRLARRHDGEVG